MEHQTIDLTLDDDDDSGDDRKMPARGSSANAIEVNLDQPVGTDVSADVVDLESESDGEENVEIANSFSKPKSRPTKLPKHQHPRKVREASRKRKRNVMAVLQAAKEERLRFQRETASRNFVMIDDDDDDASDVETNVCADGDNEKQAMEETQPNGKLPSPEKAQQNNEQFRWPRAFSSETDFNYQYSQETALEMQERLFREAAARVRKQGLLGSPSSRSVPTFLSPIFDVAERHPDHWKWKEPYACLGLPRHASLALVKSQYRRLARIYHPDKSKLPNTSAKFHGIAVAYRKLAH